MWKSFSLRSLKLTFLLLIIAVPWFFCGELSLFLSVKTGYGYHIIVRDMTQTSPLAPLPWEFYWVLGFSFNSMNYFICFQEIYLQVIQKCFLFLTIRILKNASLKFYFMYTFLYLKECCVYCFHFKFLSKFLSKECNLGIFT